MRSTPPGGTALMGRVRSLAVRRVDNLHSFWNFPESWRELTVKTLTKGAHPQIIGKRQAINRDSLGKRIQG